MESGGSRGEGGAAEDRGEAGGSDQDHEESSNEREGGGEGRGAAALGVITRLVYWPVAVEDILRRLT